jgi:TonB family protein
MEAFALYLFRSTVWLSCFALVYFLFLRNERYFVLIRFFLLGGLVASLLFPLITVRYTVNVPINQSFDPQAVSVGQPQAVIVDSPGWAWETWLWTLYSVGALVFIVLLAWQLVRVLREARRSVVQPEGNFKVVYTRAFSAPFTCFSYVFVNPSLSEPERREIIMHETAHVEQYHWIDIVLTETVLWMQWFNPVAWIYSHFIKQNHEFLADQQVLIQAAEPAKYKAVLLNQIMGGEVLSLSHFFNYSLNKKRFKMMTHKPVPAWHKLKLLCAIPMVATLFYAFANPEYKHVPLSQPLATEHMVDDSTKQQTTPAIPLDNKDVVIKLDGKIIDEETLNKLNPQDIDCISVNKDASKVAEMGFKGKKGVIEITSKKAVQNVTYQLETVHVVGYGVADSIKSVLNKQVNPTTKDQAAKKEEVLWKIDEMPSYPGGQEALFRLLARNIIYPDDDQKKGIQGTVFVKFIISKTGEITNPKVVRGVSPTLDKEALRVVGLMSNWTPGTHKGQKVDVEYSLPVNFVLKQKPS